MAIERLVAIDADGTVWPTQAVPIRPRLWLRTNHALADAQSPVLLALPPSASLHDDLERAPLRQEHGALAVASTRSAAANALRIQVDQVLTPNSELTLALPAWAEDTAGQRPNAPQLLPLRVAQAEGGASFAGMWPPSGSAGVLAHIEAIALHFRGALPTRLARAELRAKGSYPLPLHFHREPCHDWGWPRGVCFAARLEAPLTELTTYTLALGEGWRDATGIAFVGPVGHFTTGGAGPRSANADAAAPAPPACHPDETLAAFACALIQDRSLALRVALPQAARLWLSGPTALSSQAPRGEAQLHLPDLTPDILYPMELRLQTVDGRELSAELALRTHPTLASLSITEVAADPPGSDSAGEYVEVLNYGRKPLALDGYRLSDDPAQTGDTLRTPIVLAPGGVALLVAEGFRAPAQLPQGVPLVRTDGSLASNGLSQNGEMLVLRDPHSRRIAEFALPATTAEGLCWQQSDWPERKPLQILPSDPCTPGTLSPQ